MKKKKLIIKRRKRDNELETRRSLRIFILLKMLTHQKSSRAKVRKSLQPYSLRSLAAQNEIYTKERHRKDLKLYYFLFLLVLAALQLQKEQRNISTSSPSFFSNNSPMCFYAASSLRFSLSVSFALFFAPNINITPKVREKNFTQKN